MTLIVFDTEVTIIYSPCILCLYFFLLNLSIYSCSHALPEWHSFISAIQAESIPALRHKIYAAVITFNTSNYEGCLERVWYCYFSSGCCVVCCVCCRQCETKLQELQKLSAESTHQTGIPENQHGKFVLSHPISHPKANPPWPCATRSYILYGQYALSSCKHY